MLCRYFYGTIIFGASGSYWFIAMFAYVDLKSLDGKTVSIASVIPLCVIFGEKMNIFVRGVPFLHPLSQKPSKK